jgi:hypothetical protein
LEIFNSGQMLTVPCSTSLVERFHGSSAGSKARQRRLTILRPAPSRRRFHPGGTLDRAGRYLAHKGCAHVHLACEGEVDLSVLDWT